MDKKFNEDMAIEELKDQELLDFLNATDTYFIKDEKSGIIGDKKTGVMIDKRTGKVFSSPLSNDEQSREDLKYDFLDYKKSVEVLNSIDSYLEEKSSNKEVEERIKRAKKNLSKQRFRLKNYLDRVNKTQDKNKTQKLISKEENSNDLEVKENYLNGKIQDTEKNNINPFNDEQEVILEDIKEDVKFSEDFQINEEAKEDNIDLQTQSDEEILRRINQRFNAENEFVIKESGENKKPLKENDYNFSSFEDYEKEETLNKQEGIEEKNHKRENILDKFKTIMDFEEYLSLMPSDEEVLKSPFEEEKLETPKILVEDSNNNEEDDDFSPFDSLDDFEVEEIQSYDITGENGIEEGMIPDFNLNQSMSKKVSIREVIKHKRKKKQEQKEIQEKLFFETLDDRIEQFKNNEQHSIDSQDILNSINMDLNRINSSIKIEFENLNKRKASKNRKAKKTQPKEDKFSLQNLLEEIYEENGEKPLSMDTKELDFEAIKKDLAKKDNNRNIVN